MYGGDRVSILFFLEYFWVIVVDDSFKSSHVSKKAKLMRNGENLMVPWSIIQFIIELTYNLLSFVFGSFLFGWSCK